MYEVLSSSWSLKFRQCFLGFWPFFSYLLGTGADHRSVSWGPLGHLKSYLSKLRLKSPKPSDEIEMSCHHHAGWSSNAKDGRRIAYRVYAMASAEDLTQDPLPLGILEIFKVAQGS